MFPQLSNEDFEVYSKRYEDVKSFKVPNVGEFSPLITETSILSLYHVRFIDIPPHYHEKTVEVFQFLTPAFGSMVVGGEVEKIKDKRYVSGGETIEVKPFTTVYVPPFTPHRMKIDSPGYALAYLLTIPRLDEKDEFPLVVK